MDYKLVVGDVVNGLSGDNAILIFQPAAGVEVVITTQNTDAISASIQTFDGVNDSFTITSSANSGRTNFMNMKLFITNALHVRFLALGVGSRSAFSGVEIA